MRWSGSHYSNGEGTDSNAVENDRSIVEIPQYMYLSKSVTTISKSIMSVKTYSESVDKAVTDEQGGIDTDNLRRSWNKTALDRR